MHTELKYDKPDSSYSWIIAVGCNLMYFIQFGIVRITGLLFAEIIVTWHIDRSLAALPFAMFTSVRCLIGPLVGYLIQKFGFRFVIVLGSVFSFVGIGACFFLENITAVLILWGLFAGAGDGLITAGLPHLIYLYFEKHTSTATGFALTGAPLAGFVLSPIIDISLRKYGISGTFLIIAGLVAHCFPLSIILKGPEPIASSLSCLKRVKSKFKSVTGSDERNTITCTTIISGLNLKEAGNDSFNMHAEKPSPKLVVCSYKRYNVQDEIFNLENIQDESNEKKNALRTFGKANYDDLPYHCKKDESNTRSNQESSCETSEIREDFSRNFNLNDQPIAIKGTLDMNKNSSIVTNHKKWYGAFKILWHPAFLLITIPRSLHMLNFIIVPNVTVDFSIDKDIPENMVTFVLMLLNIADLFGKVGFGWVTDRGLMGVAGFTSLSFVLTALSFVVFVWAEGVVTVMAAAVFEGLCIGMASSLTPRLVSVYIEPKKQTLAMTSIDILVGPLGMLVPLLIGYFRDTLGAYNWLMYSYSIALLLSSLMILFLPKVSARSWLK